MNTKTIEIVKVEQISEDFFFTVKWNGGQETIALETLLELSGKNVEIVYDEENEDLEQAIENADLTYVEIASPLSADEEGYEVYLHETKVRYGEVRIDTAGQFIKEYKTYKGAMNFAKKQSDFVLEN